jgi:aspartyl/asparaginyl beta-hydroxylase (cupin superfamily)
MWCISPADAEQLWATMTARFGARDLGRIASMLEGLTRTPSEGMAGRDGRQVKNLWFPDLPSKPWWSQDELPFVQSTDWPTMAHHALEEYREARKRNVALQSYETAEADAARQLIDSRLDCPLDEGWKAIFLMRDGCWHCDTAVHCPSVLKLFDGMPLYPGDAMFSVLAAGTEIPPHHGLDNLTLTVHLALQVPAGCGIEVEDETSCWRPGELLIFDDSYRHRAWNGGNAPRIVLLFDVWHPGLTVVEVAALRYIWLDLLERVQ